MEEVCNVLKSVSVQPLYMSKLLCLIVVNGPMYRISQVLFPGQLYAHWKLLCMVKIIKGSGLYGVCATAVCQLPKLCFSEYTLLLLKKSRS